jgi:hypothetical protein
MYLHNGSYIKGHMAWDVDNHQWRDTLNCHVSVSGLISLAAPGSTVQALHLQNPDRAICYDSYRRNMMAFLQMTLLVSFLMKNTMLFKRSTTLRPYPLCVPLSSNAPTMYTDSS